MESQVQVTKKITLTLDEKEARWLQGYLQNYVPAAMEPEPQDHADMREKFFKALQGYNNE